MGRMIWKRPSIFICKTKSRSLTQSLGPKIRSRTVIQRYTLDLVSKILSRTVHHHELVIQTLLSNRTRLKSRGRN